MNAYLRELSGEDSTAKDFRTWAGTVLAARHLAGCPSADASAAKAYAVEAIKDVAQQLGNTVAVCRTCYIHPRVLDALSAPASASHGQKLKGRSVAGLTDEERLLVAFLSTGSTAAAA
ncbi:MAG: hypothetical protein ACT4P6_17940 [Gemmatimonadaceae bacterium]